MKSFWPIFRFELLNYLKNKLFVILTIICVLASGISLSIPRLGELFASGPDQPSGSDEKIPIAVSGAGEYAALWENFFADEKLDFTDKSETELDAAVGEGTYQSAVIVTGELSYKYIVKNIGMYDVTSSVVDAVMKTVYQRKSLSELGADDGKISEILDSQVTSTVVQTAGGKNQAQNFLYTYILIMALYMAIILYGQLVATSVATEKSSRAMELLITSVKPNNLMFGKVLGAGCAGMLQFALIIGSGFLFYRINAPYYADNPIVASIFGMPVSIMLYALLFFILGFFVYAFMYGALGSMVSRLEQLNTAVMPVTFLFVASFMIVIFAISNGNVDTPIIKAASFIPFTSPMAMFVRISMGNVSTLEIVVSVVILAASTVGIGMLAASVYRLGVLMYGQPPKLGELFALLRNKHTERK